LLTPFFGSPQPENPPRDRTPSARWLAKGLICSGMREKPARRRWAS
jgi:hypothetical protein